MKAHWLNKNNNENLIVFFAGWSFDYKPFEFLSKAQNPHDFDILVIYDYNDFEIPNELENLATYNNKILIAWSMGVFAAYKINHLFNSFTKKIAINGTTTPVDDNFGIPVKMFELTLKHAQKGLEGKFYQNIFYTEEEYQKYCQSPVERTIDNRVSELENLYNTIKKTSIDYKTFYDFAIVSDYDKIIPTKNQIASHNKNAIPVISVPYGHHPYYNYSSWKEIIDADRL